MVINSLKDLESFAASLVSKIKIGDCILLSGPIGSGKTTFSRFFINALQAKNNLPKTIVQSPTFNILYEYKIKDKNIMHYDFYRLKKLQEINNLDFEENIENCITLIEWPELLEKNKIHNRLEIDFNPSKMNNSRKIKISAKGRLRGKI